MQTCLPLLTAAAGSQTHGAPYICSFLATCLLHILVDSLVYTLQAFFFSPCPTITLTHSPRGPLLKPPHEPRHLTACHRKGISQSTPCKIPVSSAATQPGVCLFCDPRRPPCCRREIWAEGMRSGQMQLPRVVYTDRRANKEEALDSRLTHRLTRNLLTIFSVTEYAYAQKRRGPHTLLLKHEGGCTLSNKGKRSRPADAAPLVCSLVKGTEQFSCHFSELISRYERSGLGQPRASHLSHRDRVYAGCHCRCRLLCQHLFSDKVFYPKMSHKIASLPNWSRSFNKTCALF